MRPRIGIARRRDAMDGACAHAVAEAGGEPVWLGDAGPADPLLAGLAALLLPGGPDFVPEDAGYADVRFEAAAPERLALDRALLASARAAGLPVLGICYGMQLLALESGGRLHHHLPRDVPGSLLHQGAGPDARHAVELVPGTRLAALFGGRREIAVNSRHHQAVSQPGAGLCVAARAADGVIEGVEGSGGLGAPFVLGVQWHPENLEREHRAALFGAFVEAARRAQV